ncbi:flagellar assembly protein FliW [Oceanobacillus polygoni]|uniref:Flagellar assembly factor FliW n=1 Tax=Oceanobacillus polygoni TaxID=1235259 RepID=A0A9X1CDC7_9BACI|nr:flagellar assembly protein FliW [Oceanobacillus polygoni]MBP2078911.1 flagellar assembly factor FliW [Oceanobacillus polygoni]
MNIQTKYLGEVAIDERKIIHFSTGIPGFPDETAFVLMDLPDTPIFQILQAVRTPSIAFIVANPYQIYPDYSLQLDDNLIESLQIKDEKEVAVLSIVTLKQPFQTSTLNLKAPIIINTNHRQGKQYILNTDAYSSQAPITPQSVEREG